MSRKTTGFVILAVGAALLAGCAAPEEAPPAQQPAPAPAPPPAAPVVAVAKLMGPEGSTVTGSVSFTQTAGGVAIAAHVEGAPPGTHGLHLHDVGECTPPDFKTAGGHYNPTDMPHGAPTDAEHHAGDFGNIEVGQDGVGHLELTSAMLSVDGEYAALGKAVILHEKADDLVSQPTGAAGGRLACGVVAMATGEAMAHEGMGGE